MGGRRQPFLAHLFSGAHPAHKTEPEFTSQQGPSPRDHEEKETTKVSLAWEDPGRQNGEGFWKEEMSELRPKGSREFESILSPEEKKKKRMKEETAENVFQGLKDVQHRT